ncbi:ATP-grasp domain-containing protein [Flavobacterium dankookense]|uniref:Carbamoyl-phosphate synthase large subunit n=1 Tax=Flavobacterium dankookense TaxID=706186 RepID=A0A4R6QAJ9_9FLAO|nr:ATP-grasp domain-containing protein [Flavobacterium dankookense]TDP59210.1 carbamoyl-phosphate synthase large subunit [Flavobacterium dankookense]
MERKTVLVTGIGGNVGQGVLRNIIDLNLDIFLIGTDVATFTAGNYLCDVTYKVPYAFDTNYISEISAIVEKHRVDIILPTTDYEVYFLSLNQDKIKSTVVASDSSLAKKYLDKYLTFLHHQELNIPFAKTWLPSQFVKIDGDIIVKPREGRGSRGIEINPENPSSFSDEYLIQPLHKGKEITTAFYVKKDGSLHGLFTMERELTNGATSKSKTCNKYDAELEKIIKSMIQFQGLRGSINIQSIVEDDQTIIPFEVNCRISGTNSIRHNLGFQDVKYSLQEYLYNQEPDEVKTIEGIATRLLYDVIYPNATDENLLNNNSSNFKLY